MRTNCRPFSVTQRPCVGMPLQPDFGEGGCGFGSEAGAGCGLLGFLGLAGPWGGTAQPAIREPIERTISAVRMPEVTTKSEPA
jgi:hypothetical protein